MARRLYTLCGADEARRFSPHCWKAVMALRHKGLDFEEVPVSFTKVPSVAGRVSATVPVLDDHGVVVKDSFAIALYLEDTYPEREPLFRGEGGRSLSRFVEGWAQSELHSAIARIALVDIHDLLDDENKIYFRQSREKTFNGFVSCAASISCKLTIPLRFGLNAVLTCMAAAQGLSRLREIPVTPLFSGL